ncbi:hypothetical protein EAO70_06030, partial [Streptomyces sp. adm13(2018)]|uniref:DUF6919 domain-containing protein n=1 Tax=Streptomyces sp. adm13(2018) TaxID=2479007 RepID=UPI0013A1E1FE
QNMAGWLEGRVPNWPGYLSDEFGAEEENGARHLVPVLVTLNRAGFVTVGSQPGEVDGRYRQRASVDGIVHDHGPLFGRLLALQGQGFTVVRGWPKQQHVMVTRDQALAAADEIVAATQAGKAEADRHGGSDECDAALAAALRYRQHVLDTPDPR